MGSKSYIISIHGFSNKQFDIYDGDKIIYTAKKNFLSIGSYTLKDSNEIVIAKIYKHLTLVNQVSSVKQNDKQIARIEKLIFGGKFKIKFLDKPLILDGKLLSGVTNILDEDDEIIKIESLSHNRYDVCISHSFDHIQLLALIIGIFLAKQRTIYYH